MGYFEQIREENEAVRERYELAADRVNRILLGECRVKEPYKAYFQFTAEFLSFVTDTVHLVETNKIKEFTEAQLEEQNKKLYCDITGKAYETSYANPVYAVSLLGEEYGPLLGFLYTELRALAAYAFEEKLFEITIAMELYLEILNLMEEEDTDAKSIKSAIYYYVSDYCGEEAVKRLREKLDPSWSFAAAVIHNEDLSDLRYLYYFGEFISENEIKTARFLNSLSEEAIETMAATFTKGYEKGFENAGINLASKKTVELRWHIGFERMVRAVIRQFGEMGLSVTLSRAAAGTMNKSSNGKIGFHGTSPNNQYDYDHRYDQAIYCNKSYFDRRLAAMKDAYEFMKEEASVYAGPALIEVFGEKPFEPENKKEACTFSENQRCLSLEYQRDLNLMANEYIKGDEISFSIIAYPLPEIGPDYEEIFQETVKVNTLDVNIYQQIQQTIIDALDKGEYVRVTGRNGNHTDIKVMLAPLTRPREETNFENCLADVNIPVGEVFTSPKLTGTQGVLHVKEVYLQDLNFKDLTLRFEDGKITDYSCANFEEEKDSRQYVKENLLMNHETLPIGEFAIGTNTTAYRMGIQYGISPLLPILIAEKTGPHFAVGDTCYRMGEDMVTYNPDGKRIAAKDNECSMLRKTDMEKAYFNCHTDITIPYHELDTIAVHTKEGEIAIIKEGRFVLPGTEALNQPLDEEK